MCNYIENLTAERVKRVISGYGEGKNAVESTGGSFDFYELGETVFDPSTGLLNEEADIEHIKRYIWYSETNSSYSQPAVGSHPYLLGSYKHTNYYWYCEKDRETCLNWDFLNTLTEADRAEQYIIYADKCVLEESELLKFNIVYKKCPHDIKKV